VANGGFSNKMENPPDDISIFDDFGYLKQGVTDEFTYSQIKSAIAEKATETKVLIGIKEQELSKLKLFLSALEHNDRTVWLLYQDNRPPERKVLG
jgi:hypothetical protein